MMEQNIIEEDWIIYNSDWDFINWEKWNWEYDWDSIS